MCEEAALNQSVLNSIIKFDLHIHSKASEYKESAGVVEQSTKENIGVLLYQLNLHNVALFSITDHNRFDPELYSEINKILKQADHPYPNVKSALAGVEFDVIIEEGMEKCHIIAIFDTNSEEASFRKIETGLKSNLLEDKEKAYSKSEFEEIIKKIELNTILIASQRKDIHNQNGKHNSLSDSTTDVEQIIRVGYIDAMEFQKPKVEGILLNNLRELSLPISLVSGSDCHDWTCYPYHDKKNQNLDFFHSKAKILPTFKGLLMAVTSPETRFNCSDNRNISTIDNLQIRGDTLPLVNGVNAIIGENGSGKTTLLKLITGKTSEAFVKRLICDNDLRADNSIDSRKMKYIGQGQIIKRFNEKTLFSMDDGSVFKELDHMPFREVYTAYAEGIRKGIESQIKKTDSMESLSKYAIAYEDGMVINNYYVEIKNYENFGTIKNPHEEARKDILEIISKTSVLNSKKYFDQYKDQIKSILIELNIIKDDIELKWMAIENEASIKNIIHRCANDYSRKVKEHSSAKDREIKEYNKKKKSVVEAVAAAIKQSIEMIEWPEEPPVIKGVAKNPLRGFNFNREAEYNGASVLDNFYAKMFLKDYSSIDKLKSIITNRQYFEAIRNCTSMLDIEEKWEENFEKFFKDSTNTREYITEGTGQQIGNTLGEMSLSYYKFFTQDDQDYGVLVVDQPEDNISNNNISKKLIGYFNAIRDEKQIIFVTHNPLLVVNLDVDNVIFVENNNGELTVRNGCLEYEDERTNILELVAQNMDGGKETIEKRLRVYGKSHKIGDER